MTLDAEATTSGAVEAPADSVAVVDSAVHVAPDDVLDALERAVRATGREFDPLAWSFGLTKVFGYVANEVDRPEAPVLVISEDCRSAWVDLADNGDNAVASGGAKGVEDETPGGSERPYEVLDRSSSPIEKAFARLASQTPMERGMVVFTLVDESRFFRGNWHLEPVMDGESPLGWICTRPGLLGRLSKPRRFLVASNQTYTRFAGGDAESALRALLTKK